MKIKLVKANGRNICRWQNCKKNPLYISDKNKIKSKTLCIEVIINVLNVYSLYYCQECWEQVVDEVDKFHPNYWVFLN